MRLTPILALLALSACVGFVEYDPNAARDCEETSATVLFPVKVTENACP